MQNIEILKSLYNDLKENKRYSLNLKLMEIGCLNLLKVLNFPESYFVKYFLCGEVEDNPKLGNLLRFRRAYRDFLILKASSFSIFNSFEEIAIICKNRSPIQRFNYIQGFTQSKYKFPIYISREILISEEVKELDYEDCIITTISAIKLGDNYER